MPETSLELLREVSEGSRPALSALVARHIDGLHGYVRLHAGDKLKAREATADLVQLVLVEVVQEYDGFEWKGEAAFKGWLYQKALRRVIDRARYHGRQERDASREEALEAGPGVEVKLAQVYRELSTPSAKLARVEDIERLEHAFRKLPAIYAQVLSLGCLCGMSRAEVAEELGISEETAKKRKTRGLVKLAALLERGR